MREISINDSDREDFVRNDEGLYTWWRSEMRGEKKLRQFVRSHRSEIDAAIRGANQPPRKPEDEPYYMRGRGGFGPMTSPAPTNRYGQSMIGRAGQSLLPR